MHYGKQRFPTSLGRPKNALPSVSRWNLSQASGMIASASVARFDGLFRSSERSIHIAGIRTPTPRSLRRLLIRPRNTLFGVGFSVSQPATSELVNGFVPTGRPDKALQTPTPPSSDIGVRNIDVGVRRGLLRDGCFRGPARTSVRDQGNARMQTDLALLICSSRARRSAGLPRGRPAVRSGCRQSGLKVVSAHAIFDPKSRRQGLLWTCNGHQGPREIDSSCVDS